MEHIDNIEGFFCLKCIKVLQDLTDDEIMEMSAGTHEKKYSTGELIYVPAESQGQVFFLREGEVDIYQKGAHGKKFIIDTLEPGDMFGDVNLVPRSTDVGAGHFARASSDVRVCVVDKIEFMDYLQRKPQVAFRIIEELSSRLALSESKVRDLALHNVTVRLLNVLHRLSHKYGEDVGNKTVIRKRFTHEELSDRVGATRETVTKVLKELEEKEFLRYDDDRNIILNRDKIGSSL